MSEAPLTRIARAVPVAGCTAVIALQIVWPLTHGIARAQLTEAIVVVFALTSLSHALLRNGWRWTAVFAGFTFVFALALEAVGQATHFPFGSYTYADLLGPTVLAVPLIIPLAWLMMSYPVYIVSRRIAAAITTRYLVVISALVGAVAMTTWDVFLDPQMVGEQYWTWQSNAAALPGLPGIPWTNYLGWLVSSFILLAVIHSIPRFSSEGRTSDAVPATLWVWTWIGGIIANVFFLDRPGVALMGGLAMGIVTVPYLWIAWREA